MLPEQVSRPYTLLFSKSARYIWQAHRLSDRDSRCHTMRKPSAHLSCWMVPAMSTRRFRLTHTGNDRSLFFCLRCKRKMWVLFSDFRFAGDIVPSRSRQACISSIDTSRRGLPLPHCSAARRSSITHFFISWSIERICGKIKRKNSRLFGFLYKEKMERGFTRIGRIYTDTNYGTVKNNMKKEKAVEMP